MQSPWDRPWRWCSRRRLRPTRNPRPRCSASSPPQPSWIAAFRCSPRARGTTTLPAAKVSPAELKVGFSNINIDEGSADSDTGFGASFISVRFVQGYLHLMLMSDAGPLYLTTVLAREAGAGRLMAVHTRLEYSPTVIPGFTSRPEMYIGSCTAGP